MDRQRQNLIFTIAGSIGVFLIILIGISVFVSQRTIKYTHDRFTVSYPADWRMAENYHEAAVVFQTPQANALDTFYENVSIVIQDLRANPLSLRKYSEIAVDQVKAVFENNIIVLEEQSTYLSGQAGFKFVYVGRGEELDIQMMSIWTVKDEFAYQINFTATAASYDKYWPKVEALIKSFRIK